MKWIATIRQISASAVRLRAPKLVLELSLCGEATDRSIAYRHRRKAISLEAGQSLVEIAFVLPVLLLLLVGIIEIGRFSYYSILVANAARAGAQYGAQDVTTAFDPNGIKAAARKDGQVPGINLQVNVPAPQCGCSPAALGVCPAAGGCANPVMYVEVTASETVGTLFRYPGVPPQVNLTSTVKMQVGR
jgi:TadE-like protein